MLATLVRNPTVAIAGIDPSQVLLGPFANQPHQQWRHFGTKGMAHAAQIARLIETEMDARIGLLLQYRQGEMSTFNADWPLIVFVLEEYGGVVSVANSYDAVAGQCAAVNALPPGYGIAETPVLNRLTPFRLDWCDYQQYVGFCELS